MIYKIKHRNSDKIEETKSTKTLSFFYNTLLGRILLKICTMKFISDIAGIYMNSRLSKYKIKKFIKDNKIKITDYEKTNYNSFNEFFTRKIISIKRPINMTKTAFISPCDSKLSVYTISNDLTLNIKNSYYTIDTIIDKKILKEYKEGYALVFRLSPTDYHRYCYIDSGYQEKNNKIKGILHTVQPIALKRYNFYKTNTREWTILHTNNFNEVVHIEIGAMTIGKIKNEHENYIFKKGEEKGYFEFGGSTIVLLVKKGIITIDEDILENSKNNIETYVKYGEKIGKKNT
ncbi:MAG: phosphatidylserine decarboxylase [Tenericutes bacterium]|nr:phosphatidylserine decarboxylase [Mycoplasmatota bacterium]